MIRACAMIAVLMLPGAGMAGEWAPELSIGVTEFASRGDGIWYQEAFPHELDMRGNSWSIGARYAANNGELYRVGYEHHGCIKSSALATASDADYHDGAPYWPLSHWYGTGCIDGVYATRRGALPLLGANAFYESGLWLYRVEWTMRVPDWIACETCQPQSIVVAHDRNHVSVGALIGVGYGFGDGYEVVATYRSSEDSRGQFPSLAAGPSLNLSFRKVF